MIAQLLGDDPDTSGRYLAEVVYGANDGIVTTFAVVSGVAGASLSPAIVLVLGVANLLADGFSMGMSNFLSRRSELDYRRSRQDAAGKTPAGAENAAEGLEDGKSPGATAAVTFLSFVVAGAAPLVPYALGVEGAFRLSVAFTALTFFLVGASRSLVTTRRWYAGGTEMLLVGMAAALVAYTVGNVLGGLA
ncbi:VIT1/CCC1 transporter family protein [Haloparvum sedimenti]|uniref:VIT1/CCC1 transporter family protein n=1 Tax=Haloparvum sedimenti TaxID=1678448 RepID=UPI00071E7AAB|nr:VIT1/CCC1 transporter family protein [Haloparvum sedimenti]